MPILTKGLSVPVGVDKSGGAKINSISDHFNQTLMLAFSEQIYFDYAYLVASVMTILLVFLYCRSMLKSWGLAAMTGAILSILYGFIFIIIQMQDYALLFGSLGVFLILAVTMYFSRRIDWFSIKGTDDERIEEEQK